MLFGTQETQGQSDSLMPSAEPTPSGQLSDPFKNMCLASQIGVAFAPSQRPPVPLFSQAAPTTCHAGSKGGGSAEDAEAPASQMNYLATQDFITPADQFDLEYDPAAPAARQRSPAQLSPNRIKRARKSDEDKEVGTAPVSLPSLGGPYGPPGRGPGAYPYAPQGVRRPINRILSPPCYRNMFQDDNENERDTFKEWRISRPAPSQQLSRFRSDFKELGCIGQGSFSKVFRARHRIDGRMYAVKRTIKEVAPEQPEFAQFLQEAQVLAHLDPHPGLVRYYGCWTEAGMEGGERLFMQLELCDIALETHVGLGERLREAEIVEVARQVASALQHLHSHGVAHMDVKPANIYLKFSENDPEEAEQQQYGHRAERIRNDTDLSSTRVVYKLGDLGQATRLQGSGTGEASVREGDSRYLPLEVMNSDYSALDKADMFSLGAMLYELTSRTELPSGGQSYENLRRGKIPLLVGSSHPFRRLIEALLSPNPADRPSAAKVLQMPPLVAKHPVAGGQENVPLPLKVHEARHMDIKQQQ